LTRLAQKPLAILSPIVQNGPAWSCVTPPRHRVRLGKDWPVKSGSGKFAHRPPPAGPRSPSRSTSPASVAPRSHARRPPRGGRDAELRRHDGFGRRPAGAPGSDQESQAPAARKAALGPRGPCSPPTVQRTRQRSQKPPSPPRGRPLYARGRRAAAQPAPSGARRDRAASSRRRPRSRPPACCRAGGRSRPRSQGRRPARGGRDAGLKLLDCFGLAAGSDAGQPFAIRPRAGLVMRAAWRTSVRAHLARVAPLRWPPSTDLSRGTLSRSG
jgi:hypothetical protein